MKHICFFGDGMVQGLGDRHHVGWPELLAVYETTRAHAARPQAARAGGVARTPGQPVSSREVLETQLNGDGVTAYTLGVAWDTSADLRLRWRDEALARLNNKAEAGLVFSFGLSDLAVTGRGGMQLSLWDAAAHAEAMVAEAAHEWPVLWVGPCPVVRHPPEIISEGEVYRVSAARMQALNDAFMDVASRLGIPYLNLIGDLDCSPRWYQALEDGNGVFPSATGHQLIARQVSRWEAWQKWMDHGPTSDQFGQAKPLPPQTLLTPKMVAMGY